MISSSRNWPQCANHHCYRTRCLNQVLNGDKRKLLHLAAWTHQYFLLVRRRNQANNSRSISTPSLSDLLDEAYQRRKIVSIFMKYFVVPLIKLAMSNCSGWFYATAQPLLPRDDARGSNEMKKDICTLVDVGDIITNWSYFYLLLTNSLCPNRSSGHGKIVNKHN